jgi:phosphohistidine phosphatase
MSAMLRLLLLRHAKSDWSSPGTRDHDRAVASRGREAAPLVGAYMAAHGLIPELVVCSTARRTKETWALIADSFPSQPKARYDERLYEAGREGILDIVRETSDSVQTLLLIGHNPGLKDFAELMVASGDLDARRQLGEKLPTAALVVIDFAGDNWARLHPRSGRLDRLITPRSLQPAPE